MERGKPTTARAGETEVQGPSAARERRVLTTPGVSRVARWGVVAWSLIGVGILVYLAYEYLLHPLRIAFPPMLIALIVVYLLNPMVNRLQARGIPRGWGTLLTYLLFLALVGLAVRFLIPIIAAQVSSFASSVPQLLTRAAESVSELARRWNLSIDTEQVLDALGPGGGAGAFVSRIFGFTVGVLHAVLALVLGLVFGFYLLVDLPKIQRGGAALIPASRRAEVQTLAEGMGRALGGFFRGQLMVATFVGLASMLALYIVGLPYWAVVGAVAGLFNLIPLIGPFIGAVPALFIAFTTDASEGLLHLEPGWPLAIGASVALLVVQQIDNHVISPNVVARTVRLHPLTVMLGLLVGGTILGIWGMLLAVPVVAAAKIVVLHYWDTRLQWPPRGQDVSAPATLGAVAGVSEAEPGADAEAGRRKDRDPADRRPEVLPS